MNGVSRRDALGLLGGATLGGLLAGLGVVGLNAGDSFAAKDDKAAAALWTPHKLDPAECAPVAHFGYYHQGYGCCYGAFESIVGGMGRKHGAPYNQFPFAMMEVGKSGISDWGTICGALLGAASAMALFWGRKERDPMVTELFRWYEKTAFPSTLRPRALPASPGPCPPMCPAPCSAMFR